MTRPASMSLARALRAAFANFAGLIAIEEQLSREWASITFSGERHRLRLRLDGPHAAAAADAFLDGLAEREFDLGPHILIDIACVGETREGDAVSLVLEALTIEAD